MFEERRGGFSHLRFFYLSIMNPAAYQIQRQRPNGPLRVITTFFTLIFLLHLFLEQ
jgi:hypothetical protein